MLRPFNLNCFTGVFLFVYFSLPFYTYAQQEIDSNRYRYVEIRGHTGFHAYTGSDDLKPFLDSGYGAVDVRIGWQPSNASSWASKYGYPSFGLGFFTGAVGSPQIFGKPNAIFGFSKFHLSKDYRRNIFNIEPAVGLTFNLEPYDPVTNPLNNAIGARMAVFFNLRFGFTYKLTREIDITYGLEAIHMSNGRIVTPNWGLNMIGIHLGMSYNFNPDQRNTENYNIYDNDKLLPVRYLRPKKEKNEKYTENNNFINIYGALGTVQSYADQGTDVRFNAYTVLLQYQHKFNNMHSVSAGFDYLFDGSLIENYPDDPSKRNHYAIHAGYDFMMYRFTIMAHLGFYLNENKTKLPYYFRPALRYDINKWFYAQVGLKAKGFAADWVEFGVGFRPFNW